MNLVIYRIYPSTPNERFYACTDVGVGYVAKYLSIQGEFFNAYDGNVIKFCSSQRDMIRFIKRYFANVKIGFKL
jgi:hypothetical protein